MSEFDPLSDEPRSERGALEAFDDFLPSGDDADTSQTRVREGLPQGYRMRADAHYVEQLESARAATPLQHLPLHLLDAEPALNAPALVDSVKRFGVLEPLLVQKREGRYKVLAGHRRFVAARAAGLREVPCLVHRVDDVEASALAQAARIGAAAPTREPKPQATSAETDVLTSLGSIASCAALVAEAAPGLTKHVAVDLIRAEAWRSTCVLQAARIVKQGVAPTKRRTRVGALMTRLVESVEHERRLRGVHIDTVVSAAPDTAIVGQEDVLLSVLSGLVLLTTELVGRSKDASVVVAAQAEPSGRVALAVSQDTVSVPESWPSVVGEPGPDGAGTWSTPLPILAVRRVADAYGGTVSTTRFANGSRLILELPIGKDASWVS